MIPTKKISLTLLEFAQPLISDLPEGYAKSDLEAVLKLATCIWNACVIDQWNKNTQNVAELKQRMASEHPAQKMIVDTLIARKKQLFGHDPRAISNECVLSKEGQFVVRAEARLDLKDIDPTGSLN